jgi:hypothetical protein
VGLRRIIGNVVSYEPMNYTFSKIRTFVFVSQSNINFLITRHVINVTYPRSLKLGHCNARGSLALLNISVKKKKICTLC